MEEPLVRITTQIGITCVLQRLLDFEPNLNLKTGSAHIV